jgi:hypothetical protein
LADRRSVRRTQRRTLGPQKLPHAVNLRHRRCTNRRIAKVVSSPLSTVATAIKALGLGRLRNLEPKPPVQRYQWEKPGDMIHVDTKQLARFERVGHRITGDRRQGCSRGGWPRVSACRRRRRHTPGLCRGASRRAEDNDCWLPGSVTARKDDAPAAVQAAIDNVAGSSSISACGGLIHTTSG